MSKVETRGGLRRFIPFLREKRVASPAAKEEIKDGEVKIPADVFSKEGIATLWVLTHRIDENWTTTVTVYNPNKHAETQPRIVGKKKFNAFSKDEALEKEISFMDENLDVLGYDPKELKGQIDISDIYSQRVYRVSRKK